MPPIYERRLLRPHWFGDIPMYRLELQPLGFRIRIDPDRVTVQHFAVQNLHGQWVLHQPLNRALQRTRTVVRVVAFGWTTRVR